jgi:hypothetical protein
VRRFIGVPVVIYGVDTVLLSFVIILLHSSLNKFMHVFVAADLI